MSNQLTREYNMIYLVAATQQDMGRILAHLVPSIATPPHILLFRSAQNLSVIAFLRTDVLSVPKVEEVDSIKPQLTRRALQRCRTDTDGMTLRLAEPYIQANYPMCRSLSER